MKKEIKEFLAVKESHGLSKKTLNLYYYWLCKLEKLGGNMTDPPLEDFKRILSLKYKEKTVQLAFNIIHNFFKFWNGEIKCLNHERIKVPRARADHYPAITKSEHQLILKQLKDYNFRDLQYKLLFSMLWDTGGRIEEILGIRHSELDMKRMCCDVKTEKSYKWRKLFWSFETHRILVKYMKTRIHFVRSEFLFVGIYHSGNYSNRISSKTVQRTMAKLREKARIMSPVVPHSYRHAAIQRWFEQKISPHEIILLTGHSSVMALESYMRLGYYKVEALAQRSWQTQQRQKGTKR